MKLNIWKILQQHKDIVSSIIHMYFEIVTVDRES